MGDMETNMTPLNTIALLARPPGLRVLRDALLDNPKVRLTRVFTHGRLPSAEGGGTRGELEAYRTLCEGAGVPLTVLDLPEARSLQDHLPEGRIDLLVSLSWRCLVSPQVLARIGTAAINLHRGALPAYAGAEPVRRALKAGETRVAITAHGMVEAVDAGPVLGVVWLDVERSASDSLECLTERTKTRLEPLYAPLARLAIDSIIP